MDVNEQPGTEAPPPPDRSNHAPDELTREYTGRGIRVQWYASRCIHAADCIRALPRVFNPRRRPWIDLERAEAEADAVADAVLRCPTGALHYERFDGGPQETVEPGMRAVTVPDGPVLLRGEIEIFDHDGTLVRKDTRVALCRCGGSKHMPFCDNTHRAKE